MSPSLSRPSWRKAAVAFAVSAAAYAVVARFSLLLAIPPGYATAVWPPAGIALALALLWGRWAAAGVAVGATLANTLIGLGHAAPGTPFPAALGPALLSAGGIGLASALQAGLGARLVRRVLGNPPDLLTARDILLFPPLVAAGCLVSASLSVAWLSALGAVAREQAAANWLTWWAGDAVGVLVVTPLTLTWAGRSRAAWWRRRWTVGLPLLLGGALAVFLFHRLADAGDRAAVLLGGFLAVSLLGAFLLALTGRTQLVEAEVFRRTAQLSELNGELAERNAEEARMREEVRALNRDLARRVAERTAELETARIEAESASRAKSAFLANMSHEVRTPMNGILGLAELIGQSPLPPREAEWLAALKESAESLMHLLNEILDLSKIEAGEMALERVPFPPREELEAAVRLMAARARQKGLALCHEVAPDVPDRVVGDGFRFRQIVLNLVGNAVKFTERGSVVVRLESAPASGGGPAGLLLTVADTGPGISQDKLEKVFQPFAQADSSITRKFGGTGLGLSICRRLAALMGGSVGAENRAGGGAVFRVRLVLPPVPDTVPACPPAPNIP